MDVSKIAIIMAMEEEALPIINNFKLKYNKELISEINCKVPVQIYNNSDNNIYLILNGKSTDDKIDRVGTQAAAVSTYITCDFLKPDIIISIGTCGASRQHGFQIGDVVTGQDNYIYYDRVIPLPGFEKYGFGFYPVYTESKSVADKLNIKTSVIASGNSLINTERDFEILYQNKAYIKEMEVASIAEIADFFSIPVLAIKAVTDYYDEPEDSAEQFVANFNLAVTNLVGKSKEVCDYLLKHH